VQNLNAIPDLMLVNGTLLTVDGRNSVAEAVGVTAGLITAIGSTSDVLSLRGPKTKVVDLARRTLIPGLIDPHVHLADHGTSMVMAVDVRDLYRDITSVTHMVDCVRDRVKVAPKGQWLYGFGSPLADRRMAEQRLPTRQELDAVAPEHPVVLTFGAHVIIANTKALALANITKDTPDPEGGEIGRDPETGELTGKLLERAQLLVRAAIGPEIPVAYSVKTDYHHLKAGITFASQSALSRGVTSVHDMVMTNVAIRAYQELAEEDALPLRTSLLIRIIESPIKPESLLNLGFYSGFGNSMLRLGGVKMSIDGGITGKAAAFYDPYLPDEHDPAHEHECYCGIIRIPTEELESTVDAYHRAGHRVCVHAIGDRATDMALAAFDAAIIAHPRDDHRHRIEHFGNWAITAERIEKARRLGIVPVPNLSFMHSIMPPVRSCIGTDRLKGAFGLKTMLDAGLRVITGSDGPGFFPTDPLRDIGIATSRRTLEGDAVEPQEAISAVQALRMMTIDAAWAGFEEDEKGSIELGKLADFAILERNPLETAFEDIGSIDVDATLINGKFVFQRAGAEMAAAG
jgi:predicted amidohydrolase YtcJ